MEKLLSQALPFWGEISAKQRALVLDHIKTMQMSKGQMTSYDGGNCTGIQILKSGRIRIFIMSPNGNQITLYRLLSGDACILSAACMIQNIDFEIYAEVEQDTEVLIIPKQIFAKIKEESSAVADFVLEMVSSRFSDVMWVMNQLVFGGTGKRLAEALIEHSNINNSLIVDVTHDMLANDLGTAREVVTRLLKQFQLDGYVKLSRGKIELLDKEKLMKDLIRPV